MKTRIAILLAGIAVCWAPAQSQTRESESGTTERGLIETVANIEKKTDKFNLYLNMHGDFAANWRGDNFEDGKFEMKQLRLEMRGNINSWLSYRYRQRLNKGNNPSYRDNVLGSIDIAGIGVNLKKWNVFLGKQCASYGGIEFDLNPIEIYQYCDMIEYMSNFMTGVNVAYNFTPNQRLQFQMLNSLTGSTKEMYGDYEKAKMPMVYTLNWNGNFSDFYKTRWSASIMNETKGEHMFYYALGNEFNFTDRLHAYVDWMYSREGVDRKGIMTSIIGADNGRNVKKAEYMSTVVHLNYEFAPKWNVFAKASYETANLSGDYTTQVADGADMVTRSYEKGNYRTTWQYMAGVEFYPLKDRNLHFFAAYVGQSYKFTERARKLGNSNYSENRLSVGFIWQMPIF